MGFLVLGLIWFLIGLSAGNSGLYVISLMFLIAGGDLAERGLREGKTSDTRSSPK